MKVTDAGDGVSIKTPRGSNMKPPLYFFKNMASQIKNKEKGGKQKRVENKEAKNQNTNDDDGVDNEFRLRY